LPGRFDQPGAITLVVLAPYAGSLVATPAPIERRHLPAASSWGTETRGHGRSRRSPVARQTIARARSRPGHVQPIAGDARRRHGHRAVRSSRTAV
jgi:hypothetical protein